MPFYENPQNYQKKLEFNLDKFNPHIDYLLLTGDPLNIGLCVFIALSKHSKVDCLKWDRQRREYYVVRLGEDNSKVV